MNEFLATMTQVNASQMSHWLTIALIHFLWQGIVWAALSAMLGRLLSRSTAQSRYLVHVTALTGMTLGFAVTLWICRPINISATTTPTVLATTAVGNFSNPSSMSISLDSTADKLQSGPTVEPTQQSVNPAAPDALASPFAHTVMSLNVANTSQPARQTDWKTIVNQISPYATAIYLTGVFLMVARLLMGMIGGHWLSRKSTRVTDSTLLQMLASEVTRMGLRVTPVLMWCERATVPVVVGILRPTILLPMSLSSGLSSEQVAAILAHELAHVRRGDLMINLFQRAVEAVLFFHPAVWYVSHRIRVERENCCDDCVISAGWQRLAYVDALLRMAELSVWQHGLSLNLETVAATGNSSSEFKRRILRLLSVPADAAISVSRTSAWLLTMLGMIGLSTLLYAQQSKRDAPANAVPPRPTDVILIAGTPTAGNLASDTSSPSKSLASLTAIVVQPDGTPVPDIDVTGYYNDGRLIKSLKTDVKGRVQIPGEWAIGNEEQGLGVTLLAGDGRQQLAWYSFRLNRYLAEQRSKEAGNSTASSVPLRLVLTNFDRTIRGRLIDAQQAGVPNIRVAVKEWSSKPVAGLTSYGAFRAPGLPLPMAVTDLQGRFALRVPAGFNVGGVTTSDEFCQVALYWKEQQDEITDQVLQPGGRVKGIVKEAATGKIVPNAPLFLRGISLDGKYGSFTRVVSDAKGEFHSPALLPDHYKVSVQHMDDRPELVLAQPIRAKVTSGKSAVAEVLMTEGTVIQGQCVDGKSGQPVAKESIQLRVKMGLNPQGESDYFNRTQTDAQGNFRFVSPPGICTISSEPGKRQSHPDSDRIIQLQQGKTPAKVILRVGPLATSNLWGPMPMPIQAREAKKESIKTVAASPPQPVRPKMTVELVAPDNLAIGEYIVRSVTQGNQFVSEKSLKQGAKFEQEFMDYEVGRKQRLLIDIPGFTPTWTEDFKIEPRMATLKVTLKAEEFVSVQGRVVDSQKQALPGARIRVRRIYYGKDSRFPWGPETITDANGQYTLNHIRRGEEFVLVIEHESQPKLGKTESKLYRVQNAKPITVPDLILSIPDQVLAGIVTDQDGLPVPAAKIEFEFQPRRETTTDAQGKFKLDGLPHGRLELKLTAPDGSTSNSVVVSGTQDARIFLPLQSLYNRPENNLKLTVNSPAQAGKLKWTYYLINNEGHSVSMWATRELSESNVEKIDLGSWLRTPQPPHLKLAIVAEGYKFVAPISLKLRPKVEPVTINLEPVPSPKLTIKVVDPAGKPIVGAKVGNQLHFTPEVNHSEFRYVNNRPDPTPETNADGIREFHDLPHGIDVSIFTNASGLAGKWSDRVTLDKDMSLTLTLAPATRVITGQVQDISGAPITNATIGIHGFAPQRAMTGPDGTFRMEQVPDGDLVISARAFGYEDQAIRIFNNDTAQPMTFKLKRDVAVELPDK